MTSIVKKSHTDMILDLVNYINSAKDTNALKGDEFAKALELIGDVAANQAKRGLLTEEQRDQIETLLPSDERYFKYPHKDIARSRKMILEGIDMGFEAANRRTMMASPVSSYSLRK
ncbi:MAG: hypothetical protein IJY25_05375 [Bacilli bacterium]|nr:hypothetical protein [Bacilli bacterium]